MSKGVEFVILWSTVILLMLIGSFHNKIAKKTQRYLVLFFIILFSFAYSYRTLGLDLRNYISYFNRIRRISLSNLLSVNTLFNFEYEPLFTLVVVIAKQMGLNANQWMLMLVLLPSLIYYTIIRKHDYPLVCYIFFMITMMFHFDLTRFFVASPFIYIAYKSNNKLVKSMCYIIAFGFHYSAAAMPLIEYLSNKRLNKRKIITTFVFAMIVGVLISRLDLSGLEHSSFRFLFKFWFYFVKTKDATSRSGVLRLLYYAINVYPLIMCRLLVKRIDRYGDKNIAEDEKNMVIVGSLIYVVVVLLFHSFSASFRIILSAYYMMFYPLSYSIGEGTHSGKISIRASGYVVLFLMYDLLMSAYYLGIAARY